MKINPATCGRCSEMLWLGEDAGLRWTADMVPLDRDAAIQAMITGRELYVVAGTHMSRYRTGQPTGTMHASHGCPQTVARALDRTTPGQSVQPTPQRPPAGQQTPFSGPSAAPSSARSAERPPFKIDWNRVGVRCSLCDRPIDLADTAAYAMIELGATVIDAFHTTTCPTR